MAKENENRVPLKERNPYKFYRRRYLWLKTFYIVFLFVPFCAVLTWYIIASFNGLKNTNLIEPVRFGIGIGIGVFTLILMIANKTIKAGKNKEEIEDGITFGHAIGWGISALVMYCLYVTTYYLVILLAVQFIAESIACFLKFGMHRSRKMMDKAQTADFNARAIVRTKSTGVAIE